MAYDRYDSRDDNRGYRDDRQRQYGSGERDDRGFFERARDEVSSWFGDESSGSQRDQDDRYAHQGSSRDHESRSDNQRRGYSGGGWGSSGYEPRAYDEDEGRQRRGREDDRFGRSDRSAFFGGGQSTSYGRGRDEGDYRNQYGQGGGESGGFGQGSYGRQGQGSSSRQGQDYSQSSSSRSYPSSMGQSGGGSFGQSQHQSYGYDQGRQDQQRQGYQSQGGDQYRPMTGDYGRGSRQGAGMGGQDFSQQQYGRQDRSQDQHSDRDRGQHESYYYDNPGPGGRERHAGSFGTQQGQQQSHQSRFGRSPHDEHYSSWRQRQIEDLDRDYDEYRKEHQNRFENEFSSFRQQRQTKRQMLQSIREHFEVVDESGQHIGTVDKVRGDKVILTKNDPEAHGVHRSFTCSLLDRVEDNKVYLTGSKDSIRSRLEEERDEGQQGGMLGGLFGGGSDGDRRSDRSASGTSGSSTASGLSESNSTDADQGPHMLDKSFSGTYDDNKKSK